MAQLIIFDLDGTLVDTAPEITDAVFLTLDEFNVGDGQRRDVSEWIGHGVTWLMKTAWRTYGGEATGIDFDVVMTRFRAHYANTAGSTSVLYPHVMDTLKALKARGIKTAILTNKDAAFTQIIVDKHALGDVIDLVLCGDQLPAPKPDPAGADRCMKTLGVDAANTLYVGDSETDVKTARAAGIPCWAVPYGYNHGRPIASAGPDREITDVSAVLTLH